MRALTVLGLCCAIAVIVEPYLLVLVAGCAPRIGAHGYGQTVDRWRCLC